VLVNQLVGCSFGANGVDVDVCFSELFFIIFSYFICGDDLFVTFMSGMRLHKSWPHQIQLERIFKGAND